jgi:universal stress protein A
MSLCEQINLNSKQAMKAKPSKQAGEIVLELSQRDEPLMTAASCGSTPSLFRLKRILVPIDFSGCAKKALQYAIPLAKEHEAALTLLYVMPTHCAVGEQGGFRYAAMEGEMRATRDKQLAALIADEVRGEVPADTLIRSGSPAEQINEVAQSLPADVIVISTHGRAGLKHALLGSVTEHVVGNAPCPVLVVRERQHEFLAL